MPEFKSLADRQADQARAREKLAERARHYSVKSTKDKRKPPKLKSSSPPVQVPSPPNPPQRPWASVRAGDAGLTYQSRTANEALSAHPWTKELVDIMLGSANKGVVTLCLVWPAKVTGLALLHALANVERIFAKDLRGLRSLLFPGTHTSRAQLHSVLANREMLSALYRNLWVQQPNGGFEVQSCTSSPAFLGALWALNDLTQHTPSALNPSLAELIPTFVFETAERAWKTTTFNPLERSLAQVERLALRRDLRQKVNLEWGSPREAPGALMVMHHNAKKETWRAALADPALTGLGRPEVLLLDATEAARRTNYASVIKIPDFLSIARRSGFHETGAVIVTDDPKTFFLLRAQLRDGVGTLSTKVWAAECEDMLLSSDPVPLDWQPVQRSNSNFSVSIVDRDASQVALAFQRLTSSAGNEDSPAYQALLEACLYILRLSNLPAGYVDLTAAASETEEIDYSSQRNAWSPIKLRLASVLDSGAFNTVRASVERAIARAEKLIDDWNEATPMASRMLAEVSKYAIAGRQRVCLVLPSKRYVLLAHRFLQRRLGPDWALAEGRIEWHTLSAVSKTLKGDLKGKHFTFIGINSDVLRILVTHPEVPHGTSALVAYRQAASTLSTLTSMKEVDAFKAYRGRIGLLAQELERRLAEVPNPLLIGKLLEMSFTFKFDDKGHSSQNGEHKYYKFDLEGGRSSYASGWVYRNVPDEDPPFRRAAASAIQPGDFIFEMSDELRAKLESYLQPDSVGLSSVVDPVRMMLKLYHDRVQQLCGLISTSTKRSVLAREIHAKMLKLDPKAADCRLGRVYYWLALQAKEDTRPHASNDSRYFKVFCKALGISDHEAEQHWDFVRNARRLNQYLGRELVARYAEILFQPESALAYRKVPEHIIRQLQQEALSCIYRVENVVQPTIRTTPSKKGEISAYPQ